MNNYKNIKLAVLTLVISATCFQNSFAQQDAMISRYMFNGLSLNPAYAGSHNYATYGALFRKQWVGFDGAPMTTTAWADIPFTEKNIGLGVNLGYDRIGATEQTDLNVSFAYHLKLTETAKLSFALRSGVSMFKSTLGEITVWDQDDSRFYNMPPRFLPNFGLGSYFYDKNYFIGFSVPNIMSYDREQILSMNPGSYPKLVRHYYASAGYVFNVNEKFDIKPSLLFRGIVSAPNQFDINLQLYYKKVVSVGASYRTNDGLVFMAELLAVPKWRFGYAYDLSLAKIKTYQSGSHEVMIAFDLIKDSGPHSVRFF